MNDEDVWFWNTVELGKPKGNLLSREHLQQYRNTLSSLEESGLLRFARKKEAVKREAHDYKLCYAAYIINDGCSDDSFENFKAGLIALGKELFYRALESPDETLSGLSQAKQLIDCEEFDYAAEIIYQEQSGAELPAGIYLPETKLEGTFLGMRPDPSNLKELYPLLFEKYWNRS